MAKLTSGNVFADGKVYKVGEDVPGDEATINGFRMGGAHFEGDPDPGATSMIVSTDENPIPTDLSGNSLLPEHAESVTANQEKAIAQAEAQEEALAAAEAAGEETGVPGEVTAGTVTQTQTTVAPTTTTTLTGSSGGSTPAD